MIAPQQQQQHGTAAADMSTSRQRPSEGSKRRGRTSGGVGGKLNEESIRSKRSNGSSSVEPIFQDDDNSEDFDPFSIRNASPKSTTMQKDPIKPRSSFQSQQQSPRIPPQGGNNQSGGGSKRRSRTLGDSSPRSSGSNGRREPEELSKFFGGQSARSGIYGTDNAETEKGAIPRGRVAGGNNQRQHLPPESSVRSSRSRLREDVPAKPKEEGDSAFSLLTDRLFDKGFEQRQRERRKVQTKTRVSISKTAKKKNDNARLPSSAHSSLFDDMTEFSSPKFPNANAVDEWEEGSASVDEELTGDDDCDSDEWSDDDDESESEIDINNPLEVQRIAAQYARVASRQFDVYFSLDNAEKEKSIPVFYNCEVSSSSSRPLATATTQAQQSLLANQVPIRELGHYAEFKLKCIQHAQHVTREGDFSPDMDLARNRFMSRSGDGSFCVKYIIPNLLTTPETGPNVAADLAFEIRILSNLPGHPNISPVYGLVQGGVHALSKEMIISTNDVVPLCRSAQEGFFFITDRIQELLTDRIDAWRHKQGYNDNAGSKFSQRLEVGLDVSSALLFLHDREIVFHIRPDKVGFDAKHACLKLFNFTEARQDGMKASDQSRFVTKSQDIRTLAYTAPEVLCNAPVTTSSDVYAFGILLWQLISLKTPFDGMTQQEHFDFVVKEHLRPRISGKWPHEIGKLLENLWDPYLRMTMKKANEELETILLF
mmetsp:Transcript_22867/g.49898  ORF Transcript_22867/g.49898 Transcript_22867/m.49898 type:complete len:711 (+) Transcript_22867:170-2302(+)